MVRLRFGDPYSTPPVVCRRNEYSTKHVGRERILPRFVVAQGYFVRAPQLKHRTSVLTLRAPQNRHGTLTISLMVSFTTICGTTGAAAGGSALGAPVDGELGDGWRMPLVVFRTTAPVSKLG